MGVVATIALMLTPLASAHLPAKLRIVAPEAGQPLSRDFRLGVAADQAGAEVVTVRFHVRLDDLYLDPASGELVDDRPSFPEFSVASGETLMIDIKGAPAGQHRIRVQPITDHEDPGNELTLDVAVRTSILPFAVAIAVIVGSVGLLWIAARKRARREDGS